MLRKQLVKLGRKYITKQKNNNDCILETERTLLRPLETSDYNALCNILQDIEVMYAWEHAFSNDEAKNWIAENLMRYARDGYSYYAVIKKKTQKLIGVSGILKETANEKEYVGLGYIFRKKAWHQGYAFECASALIDYAFEKLKLDCITAQIRSNNTASIKVAEKLGMTKQEKFIKVYREKEMPHILYVKKNMSKNQVEIISK